MNDTEQLLAAAQKTAHTAPRWAEYPFDAFGGRRGSERTTVLLFEPNADEPEHACYADRSDRASWLRGWLDDTAWYSEESEDEEAGLQPWPDFSARV
ncbi:MULTISPECIES: hypothetical protein [unclassified Streptomyces]|uniref:hypothetical protein n=1 Tax=unclassified Streptomyces TaxID=2593676 RepID=UPI0036EABC05